MGLRREKKKYERCLLIFVLLISVFRQSYAQVTFIDDNQGLSNRDVTCILQTRNGFMWFGTKNGLNRYDGYSFTIYLHDPLDKNSISNSRINALFEDPHGRLWIGTDDGLNILDQVSGKMQRVNVDEFSSQSRAVCGYTSIEAGDGNNILAGTNNGKILRFFSPVNSEVLINTGSADDRVTYLKKAADSSLWVIVNRRKVLKYHPDGEKDTSFNSSWVKEIRALVPPGFYDKTALYINESLQKFNAKSGERLADDLIEWVNQHHNAPTSVFQDKNIALWIGLEGGGLLKLDRSPGKITDYSGRLAPFLSSGVNVLYKDRTGIMWVGSNYGVIKFSTGESLFENLLEAGSGEKTADKNSIRQIVEDESGDLYIGSYRGLFRYSPGQNKIKHFNLTDDTGKTFNSYSIFSLLNDTNGFIWIGSEGKGFYRFNKKTEQFEFPAHRKAQNKNNVHSTYCMRHDQGNSILLGSSNGLFKYDIDRDSLYYYMPHTDSLLASSITEIMTIVPDGPDKIWLGTFGNGLYLLHRQKGIISYYRSSTEIRLSHNSISDLHLDTDGVLWIGTRGGGLNVLDPNNGKMTYYTKTEGLADNIVAGIEENNNNLWISTFNGLSVLDKERGTIRNYYEKDGISDHEFNIKAHCKTNTGRLFFGGLNGIISFYPDSILRRIESPPLLYFTAIENGANKNVNSSGFDFSSLKKVRLSHNDKYIIFHFALADYFNPAGNRFFYKIQDTDEKWNNLGDQHYLRLTGLPAGDHRILIRGINSDGVYSANILSVTVSVDTIWYMQPWFIGVILAVIVLIPAVILRYRHKQQLKLQVMRTRISSDLHDEVGSILTRISLKAELINQNLQNKEEKALELAEIARASRLATSTMNDVLWSIDGRNDKMGHLIDHMREHAQEVLFSREIQVDFIVTGLGMQKEIPTVLRQNLFLIFKEAINNIAKHSDATQVRIRMRNENKQFVMFIADNGSAVSPSNKNGHRKGQGLENMKMRAANINAVLSFESQPGFRIWLTRKSFC